MSPWHACSWRPTEGCRGIGAGSKPDHPLSWQVLSPGASQRLSEGPWVWPAGAAVQAAQVLQRRDASWDSAGPWGAPGPAVSRPPLQSSLLIHSPGTSPELAGSSSQAEGSRMLRAGAHIWVVFSPGRRLVKVWASKGDRWESGPQQGCCAACRLREWRPLEVCGALPGVTGGTLEAKEGLGSLPWETWREQGRWLALAQWTEGFPSRPSCPW